MINYLSRKIMPSAGTISQFYMYSARLLLEDMQYSGLMSKVYQAKGASLNKSVRY